MKNAQINVGPEKPALFPKFSTWRHISVASLHRTSIANPKNVLSKLRRSTEHVLPTAEWIHFSLTAREFLGMYPARWAPTAWPRARLV
jgi:hypothetical protein